VRRTYGARRGDRQRRGACFRKTALKCEAVDLRISCAGDVWTSSALI
jgi:hypothetical protein